MAALERQYGFDKPPLQRLWLMLSSYARLDFGESFYRDARVIDLIAEKLPVSLSLGLWATLITYLVSIPWGWPRRCATAAPSTCGAARWW